MDLKAFCRVLTKAKGGRQASTLRDLIPLFHAVHQINNANRGRNTRIDALEKRIAELETSRSGSSVGYAGVHEVGKQYLSGSLVTRSGGLWLALRETTQTPGTDPLSWRLVVKEGQPNDSA